MRTGISLSWDLINCKYLAFKGLLYLWLFFLGKKKEAPGGIQIDMQPFLSFILKLNNNKYKSQIGGEEKSQICGEKKS